MVVKRAGYFCIVIIPILDDIYVAFHTPMAITMLTLKQAWAVYISAGMRDMASSGIVAESLYLYLVSGIMGLSNVSGTITDRILD